MFSALKELFFVIYNMLFCNFLGKFSTQKMNFLGSSMWITLGIILLIYFQSRKDVSHLDCLKCMSLEVF